MCMTSFYELPPNEQQEILTEVMANISESLRIYHEAQLASFQAAQPFIQMHMLGANMPVGIGFPQQVQTPQTKQTVQPVQTETPPTETPVGGTNDNVSNNQKQSSQPDEPEPKVEQKTSLQLAIEEALQKEPPITMPTLPDGFGEVY